jgi:hypothetical protein
MGSDLVRNQNFLVCSHYWYRISGQTSLVEILTLASAHGVL